MSVQMFFLLILNLSCGSVYWENFSDQKKTKILMSENIPSETIDYYNGRFIVSDNRKMFELLETLTTWPSDKEHKAFFFYLFNKIVLSSDASLLEGLGNYIQKIFLLDLFYVLDYLIISDEMIMLYAEILGTEFYFKEEGVSDLKYSFKQFQRNINVELNGCKRYNDILLKFYENIQLNMRKMN